MRLLRLLLAVLRHPGLWHTAATTAWRLRANGSLLPSRAWVAFRIETAYGIKNGTLADMRPEDLVDYLRWCRAFPGRVR